MQGCCRHHFFMYWAQWRGNPLSWSSSCLSCVDRIVSVSRRSLWRWFLCDSCIFCWGALSSGGPGELTSLYSTLELCLFVTHWWHSVLLWSGSSRWQLRLGWSMGPYSNTGLTRALCVVSWFSFYLSWGFLDKTVVLASLVYSIVDVGAPLSIARLK